MPFLEVLTRVYKRPQMLAVNVESLRAQTDADWMQTYLVDNVGRGINWSHENMAANAPNLTGEYVWILDDDDSCTCNTLVADLKHIAVEHDPDVIMLRMDHGKAVLPDPATWGDDPICGRIGCSAYVVKREVWQAHAGAMVPGWYGSDYSFINSIFGNNPALGLAPWIKQPTVYWHDCIASRVQRQSFGRVETTDNG
jgi:hypothetical protein